LGIGYLFAMIHIFASHAGRDGDPGLSVDDLIIAYSGSKNDTRLEAALKGPMANMLPGEETAKIVAWVRSGAEEKDFKANGIDKIVKARCVTCHSGKNPHIPNLSEFDSLKETVQKDTGFDMFTLVRVSHIHLFGITFIFFICSSIFCHSYIKPIWLKCVIIMIPFLAVILDIGSWYLTKLFEPFAWVVMISGGFMGLAFAVQWITSIYQMWFFRLPQELIDSDGVVS
ncbi:MAG: elongation factor-1 alpha, partial [Gammaproteobacteria bacterium]|nr:elongation factor-1 alpha [Gammaproteobacteria bacterium]